MREYRFMHALVIEDEYLIAQLIEDCLEALGYTSFALAMDEEQAVTSALDRCPDLITSAVQLGTGNGVDAVQRICKNRRIPVLYITSMAKTVQDRCPTAVILQKPFGRASLSAGVHQAHAAM